jgi:hypothetical protein
MSEKAGVYKIPKKGAKAAELQQCVLRATNQENFARRENEVDWLLSNAAVNGHQWVEILLDEKGRSVRRAPRLIVDNRKGIAKPTRNITLKAVDNEIARSAKRNSEVTVEPSDASDPGKRAAAKKATSILKHHLHDRRDGIRWPYIHRLFWDHNIRYGTTILKSTVLMDHLETVDYPVTTAARCKGKTEVVTKQRPILDPLTGEPFMTMGPLGEAVPQTEDYDETVEHPPCGATMAHREVSSAKVDGRPDVRGAFNIPLGVDAFGMEMPAEKAPDKYAAHSCPCCMGELEDFTPTFEEAARDKDYFDRPLGKKQPLAKVTVEVLSPFEFHPENNGLVDPMTIRQFGQVTPRTLDWVQRYYPQNFAEVRVTPPEEIAEAYPLIGEYSEFSNGSLGMANADAYNHHVLVRELHVEPTVEFPRGRSIVMAGNVVLADEDLLIQPDDPDKKPFSRVRYSVARCFIRDGEIWGNGFPRVIRGIQKTINATKGQGIDRREAGLFGVIATKGMNLVKEWANNIAGAIFRWQPDPLAPGAKPEIVQASNADSQLLLEMQDDERMAMEVLGINDAETGNLPQRTWAYSAVALAAEKSSERRQQREKEALEAITATLEHNLILKQHFEREPRTMRIQTADGWEAHEYYGADIGGETGVVVKEEPFFDKNDAEREALAAAIQMPQFAPTTKRGLREAGKRLGIPEEILSESNVQLDAASRKFFRWMRAGEIPVIDPGLDDLDLYHQELGRLLNGDEGVERADEAKWPALLDALFGWEQEFAKVSALIQGLKPLGWKSGQPIDAYMAEYVGTLQAQYVQQVQQSDMMYQQQIAMAQTSPTPVPIPMPPAPVPPPEIPEFVNQEPLKEAPQHAIYWTWSDILQRQGVPLDDKQSNYLQFRAVYDAYRLLAQQAMGGMAPAAPGSMPNEPGVPDAQGPAV